MPSPELIIVGTTLSASGPRGSWRPASVVATVARASRALRPASGLAPAWAATPLAATRIAAAALRRTTTASSPSALRSPPSKQRPASKSAKRGPCANGSVRNSSSLTSSSATSANRSGTSARARRTPSERATPPFMSIVPEPIRLSPSRSVGRWEVWGTTVSRWPINSRRQSPAPSIRAIRSGACAGDEQGSRSIATASGSNPMTRSTISSAARASPEGVETATSCSISGSARAAIDFAQRARQSVSSRVGMPVAEPTGVDSLTAPPRAGHRTDGHEDRRDHTAR